MGDDKAARIRQEPSKQEPFMHAHVIEAFGEPEIFRVVNLLNP
ncbi:hypothetical protein [Belnapia arida]|nr:hypothetical protein [Belnapia arida]